MMKVEEKSRSGYGRLACLRYSMLSEEDGDVVR